MDDENRFCPPLEMTPQQFQEYKSSKVTRIFLYIIAMIVVSIFKEKWTAYTVFTIWLLGSYWYNAKCEEQWVKDGSVREEDLR
jgi:hypothetical protein